MVESIAKILTLAIVAISFIMIWQRPKLTARAWKDFAAEHNLRFIGSTTRIRRFDQSPFWVVLGLYRGRAVKLEAYSKYNSADSILSMLSGGGPEQFTRITRGVITAKPSSYSFELRRRNATMPPSPIRTGDKQFDQSFSISSSRSDLVISIFGSVAIRESAQCLKGVLTLDTLGLHYEESGLVRDAERLRRINELLADLSSAIESVDSQHSESEG